MDHDEPPEARLDADTITVTSLRWHYPDQVRRVCGRATLSAMRSPSKVCLTERHFITLGPVMNRVQWTNLKTNSYIVKRGLHTVYLVISSVAINCSIQRASTTCDRCLRE